MKIRALLIALILLPASLLAEEKIVSEVTDFGSLNTSTNKYHYTLTNGTTYILNTSVTTDGYLYIASGSTVVIDLKESTINRNLNTRTTNGFVILNEGTLTIRNTGGGAEGKITGGYNFGSGGGIYNKGNLTIEGGTITGNKAKYWQNPVDLIGHGGGIMVESGTLHLKGGIITGNKSSLDDTRGGQGGGIYIKSGATLTIEGAPQITGNIRYSDDKKNNIYLTSGVVINIGMSRYWTFSSGVDVIIPNGLKTFMVCERSNNSVSITEIAEEELMVGGQRIVKSNNGVMFACVGNDSIYDFVASAKRMRSGTTVSLDDHKDYGKENCLVPVIRATHFDSGYYYFLKNNEFHRIKTESEDIKVPAGKAVLYLGPSASTRSSVIGIEGEGTTGLRFTNIDDDDDHAPWYDMSGRRLSGTPTQKGVYIHHHKKVVIR